MEGVEVVNGLECKIACNSSKVSCICLSYKFYYLVLLLYHTRILLFSYALPFYIFLSIYMFPLESKIFYNLEREMQHRFMHEDLVVQFLQSIFTKGIVCQISYVLDTEDFFFRLRRKKRNALGGRSSSYHAQERAQRFHRFLSAT